MQKKLNQLPTVGKLILIILLFLLNSYSFKAQAQVDEWLKTGTKIFKGGKDMFAELGKMTKEYKKLKTEVYNSSAEYNKNVKVAKGNNGSTNPNPDNIPEKNLTQPKIKDNVFTNLVCEPTNFFDGQLFPSAIISMASYKGELKGIIESISRPLGWNLYSTKSNIPLRYEIECVDKKYFDKINGAYMYRGGGEPDYLCPVIPWNYEALTKVTTTTPLNIYFRMFDEDGNKIEKLETLQLRSINDCIYYYKDVDMKFMFSAFVQEEHKEIDNILRDALNTNMAKRWVGYQSDSKEVDEQIAAIWRVLHEKGFVYSSISTTIGDAGNVHSQAVRTLDNSLKTSQANCVDGTVVLASILKKIGINPILILVPGHCFLGYYTDETNTTVKFLETTWLSNTFIYSADGKKKIEVLKPAKTNEDKNKAYMQLFESAQNYAMLEYQKYKGENSVTPIDVTLYRKLIKPIPVY